MPYCEVRAAGGIANEPECDTSIPEPIIFIPALACQPFAPG